MNFLTKILFVLPLSISIAWSAPTSYTELLDYVQEAPDQGDTNSCLFVATTGAMELIANKVNGIKNPKPFGPYDLAESFVINAPNTIKKGFFDTAIHRFNGSGVHVKDWSFDAWNGYQKNKAVWNKHPEMQNLPRVTLPQVESIKLFQIGRRWDTYVLNEDHIAQIKDALVKYKSPVMVNYNDEGYWHVILIVGFDDNLPGECYDTDPKHCDQDIGSFYIRDSFGVKVELRDYDWFRVKGNAAFVVKAKD